jgi:hypothetical protein
MCTTPQPAKSISPVPSSGDSLNAESQPADDQICSGWGVGNRETSTASRRQAGGRAALAGREQAVSGAAHPVNDDGVYPRRQEERVE